MGAKKVEKQVDLAVLEGFIPRVGLKDAAKYCNCSIRHLQEEVAKKKLRAYKPGKTLLFEIDDLNKWIKKKAIS